MNFDKSSFDQSFCDHLEYLLCDVFRKSNDVDIRSMWCDGVVPETSPLHQRDKKRVNDTRKIRTMAWIGKTGQDEYDMTVKLGPKALSRYARGLSLIATIPSDDQNNWLSIDIENQCIEIKLL